ncbi:hypothetical protein P261_00006 [Lachnospiraceae bacterium TWA4]|nr:hypothetical protein P261_00006 [Lachnospiraceae bacterium TWA4]
MGLSNKIDLKKEIRIVNPKLKSHKAQYPYDYPAMSKHMDLKSGSGAFIDTINCHMQISYNGIYSLNDGKMEKYLGLKEFVHKGAIGYYSNDVVKGGSTRTLQNKTYKLLSGKVKISDAMKKVKEYFEVGTPIYPTKWN